MQTNESQLSVLLGRLQTEIGAWAGISTAAHRFGGVEFRLGNVEIGHIHRNGMVDIPFTRKIRAVLVAEGAAQPHHLLAESGWITYFVRDETDLAGARRLFQLSYLHKSGRRGGISAEQRAALLDEIAPSPALRAAAG